jgi:hypothetical protein
LVSLFFILSFLALQWLAPYLTYTVLIEEDYDFLPVVLLSFASLMVLYPVMLAIPIAVKWIMIGRYRAGSYPLWGPPTSAGGLRGLSKAPSRSAT